MTEANLLFVYGTLRWDSDHEMGRWLRTQAEWLGPAWLPGARMYRVDWYPGVVAGAAEETVRGDLFRLRDLATWARLDAFEGVEGREDDEYRRRPAPVRVADGARHHAWVYWYRRPVAGLERLQGGDWLQGE